MGTNSVTAVFCEKAMEHVQEDRADFLANHVREAFERDVFQHHPDVRTVTLQEFSDELKTEEVQDYFKAVNVNFSEAGGLFALLDTEKTGMVEFEHFMNGIARFQGPARALDLAMLMQEVDSGFERIETWISGITTALTK